MITTVDTTELLALSLKLLGRKTKKSVLISAGKMANKKIMLPAIKRLLDLSVTLYATEGTSKFLKANGIRNQQIHKITGKKEPNIKSFLNQSRFDFIINILTGDQDYDEASDSKLIRTLAIEQGIPLITDVEVAISTVDQLVKRQKTAHYAYKISDGNEPWNLQREFAQLVYDRGGYASYHAHFDKAYLISMKNLKLSQVDMQKKWELYRYLKENYTHADLMERMSRCLDVMISQGVTYCRTFVDADSIVKLLPIKAALEVREQYKGRIVFEVGVQPLEGVIDRRARHFFEKACELADVIGGLPSRDRPRPEKHLDIIMEIGKSMNKPIDVHVDQENNPLECETELLALKTIEHGLEGKVCGIHAVSLAAKSPVEQDQTIKLLKDAGVSIIVCPSAALSMKALEMKAPLHNSIAPVVRLLQHGVRVFLGIDNIADLFMPVVDGDMWVESRMLMESCRFYDLEKVAEIACNKTGFSSSLGIGNGSRRGQL